MPMKKEKSVLSGLACLLLRGLHEALKASGSLLPLEPPPILPENRLTRGSSKRAASDENSSANLGATFQQKKREVLKDISSIFCKNSDNCVEASIQQTKPSHCAKMDLHKGNSRCDIKDSKLMLNASVESSLVEDEEHNKMVEVIEEALIALESQESTVSVEPEKTLLLPPNLESVTDVMSMHATASLEDHSIREKLLDQSKNVKDNLSQSYIDIDAVHADPQFCSLYAPDVYTNLCAAELIRRPLPDFMETVQQDITPSMRAILIDWLVEEIRRNVCSSGERTLLDYRQHLFWARGIETGESGSEVFELSAISTDHQNISEVPALPLGYLTLLEYNFLKFLPSMIAASAVFLARWTLDHSCHPWDPTLRHYSSYKASDLKEAIVALQDMQINSSSTLNAIWEKYNQQHVSCSKKKFKFVASLASPKLISSLFC